MKKFINNGVSGLMVAVFAVISFSACGKVELQPVPAPELPEYSISITSSADTLTKTGMEPSSTEGKYNAVWTSGDQMDVYISEVSSSGRFTLSNGVSGTLANFTGTVGSNEGEKTIYGFYPSSARADGTEDKNNTTVSVDVPFIQSPTLSSFDPACDILAASPMNVTFTKGQNVSVDNARFARQLAILKIVPVDVTTGSQLADDKVLNVKLTADQNCTLTGRAKLNLQNSSITEWTSQSARNYVMAGYSAADDFCVNGSTGAMVMVAPGTLSSGSTIKFNVNTDRHLVSKNVTLSSDISMPAGKVTTLRVKIDDDCVQTAGAALPFSEDFASITAGNSTSTDGSSTQWNGNDNFPVALKAYQAGGAVRLGSASASGSITTKALNLSSAFTVSFKVKGWSSVEGDVVVTAGDQSKTVQYTAVMSDSFKSVSVPFYAESSIAYVTISTTAKRCFIDDVSITSGKTKEHAIVAVDQLTLPATSGSSVPFTVTSDYSWTASSSDGALFSFSPSSGYEGKTTVNVTATSSNTAYSARDCGSITINDGTVSKTVHISQAGVPDPSAKGWAELPAITSGTDLEFCKHSELPSSKTLRNYSFLFDKDKHCALWVAWPLHACYIGSSARTNAFGYDPYCINTTYQADLKNGAYYPQGGGSASHSRGHQMPSAERTVSEEDNNTTFYATNMTPQLQSFNGGVWEELEAMERTSFICSDTLYVVSGPYFDSSVEASYAYDAKGGGKACRIPTHYWKIFLRTKSGVSGKKVSDCSAEELQCVGFWFTHEARSGKPNASDMKSVSQIETLTGFTFFPNVPNAPKSSYSASDWGL